MEQNVLEPLKIWEAFYLVVGPSAAVLIGLQFVVIVLSAEINMLASSSSVSAFGTPTIIHLCTVLLVSAIVIAPWPMLGWVAIALGVCGAAGIGYIVIVMRRARRQTSYTPVLEDWIWHAVLPLIAYAALLVGAVLLQDAPLLSLFVVSATMLLLLFIGIHNAWDTVVYIALQPRSRTDGDQE